jgi:hypothetical protein
MTVPLKSALGKELEGNGHIHDVSLFIHIVPDHERRDGADLLLDSQVNEHSKRFAKI